MKIVLLATAWGSRHGGLNSFNRDLAIALAQSGRAEVYCALPNPRASAIGEAGRYGVTILPVLEAQESTEFDWNWVDEVRNQLAARGVPAADVVWIGHDIISGPAARRAAAHGGRACAIMHMDYLAYKAIDDDGAAAAIDKHDRQTALFRAIATTFAVGPLLARRCTDISGKRPTMLIPGFPARRPKPPPANQIAAITFGRFSERTDRLKQWKLALTAFGQAVRAANAGSAPEILKENSFRVVGLDPDQQKLAALVADSSAGRIVNVIALPYSEDRPGLLDHLWNSNLALVLSWHEGFGLAGWEAVAAEVPLILSANSGLHHFIRDTLGGAGLGCLQSVDIRGAREGDRNFTQKDLKTVTSAITTVAGRMPQALSDAHMLRSQLEQAAVCTWANTARQLLDAIEAPVAMWGGSGGNTFPAEGGVARTTRMDSIPDCAELTVSTTQGSSAAAFDLVAELRMGRACIQAHGLSIEYGLSEVVLALQADGCAPFGPRLGDLTEQPWVAAEAGDKWRVSGPKDEQGMLCRRPLGDEALCRLEAAPAISKPSAELSVNCHRSRIKYAILDDNAPNSDLATNKEAILAIFLNKCLVQEGAVIELCRSKVAWEAANEA